MSRADTVEQLIKIVNIQRQSDDNSIVIRYDGDILTALLISCSFTVCLFCLDDTKEPSPVLDPEMSEFHLLRMPSVQTVTNGEYLFAK